MRRRVLALSWVALVLFLGACAAPRPSSPPSTLPDSAELLRRLADYEVRFAAMQGLAKMRIATAEKTLSFNQVLLVQKPDLLRCEVLSPFGSALLSLASDGETISVAVPGEQRFYRGPASAANVARFTQVPLRPADLVGILLWSLPRFPWQAAAVRRDGASELLVLSGEGGVVQEFTFDEAGRLVRGRYLVADEPRMQVEYREFTADRHDFPRRVELSFPSRQLTATLAILELDGLEPVPGERFSLRPPPGVDVTPLP